MERFVLKHVDAPQDAPEMSLTQTDLKLLEASVLRIELYCKEYGAVMPTHGERLIFRMMAFQIAGLTLGVRCERCEGELALPSLGHFWNLLASNPMNPPSGTNVEPD